jgi:hypothetical protein
MSTHNPACLDQEVPQAMAMAGGDRTRLVLWKDLVDEVDKRQTTNSRLHRDYDKEQSN